MYLYVWYSRMSVCLVHCPHSLSSPTNVPAHTHKHTQSVTPSLLELISVATVWCVIKTVLQSLFIQSHISHPGLPLV